MPPLRAALRRGFREHRGHGIGLRRGMHVVAILVHLRLRRYRYRWVISIGLRYCYQNIDELGSYPVVGHLNKHPSSLR